MNGRTLALILTATALLLGACSSTHYVRLRHPLHVGQVDPNTVPFQARREERPRGLPEGTLVDSASLTEVTPERICMQVNLWSLDQVDPNRGVYQNYRIALLNDDPDVEMTNAEIHLQQPTTAAYNGVIQRREQVGYRTVCSRRTRQGRCVSYRREPIFRTVTYPHVWQVSNHPAQMCFPNGGFVTPSTRRLALEVDGRGPGKMIFEWQFDSAVANSPPPAQ